MHAIGHAYWGTYASVLVPSVALLGELVKDVLA